jgi:hypothetical protein
MHNSVSDTKQKVTGYLSESGLVEGKRKVAHVVYRASASAIVKKPRSEGGRNAPIRKPKTRTCSALMISETSKRYALNSSEEFLYAKKGTSLYAKPIDGQDIDVGKCRKGLIGTTTKPTRWLSASPNIQLKWLKSAPYCGAPWAFPSSALLPHEDIDAGLAETADTLGAGVGLSQQ